MATRPVLLTTVCLLPTGTIKQVRPGDAAPAKWVYQRVGKGFGNIPTNRRYDMQIRQHVVGLNPRTPAQTSRRSMFAAAIVEWRTLTADEKAEWTQRAKSRALPGYQYFISQYMLRPPVSGTVWDGGTTTWDNGATVWDLTPTTVWDNGATAWDGGATIWDGV